MCVCVPHVLQRVEFLPLTRHPLQQTAVCVREQRAGASIDNFNALSLTNRRRVCNILQLFWHPDFQPRPGVVVFLRSFLIFGCTLLGVWESEIFRLL